MLTNMISGISGSVLGNMTMLQGYYASKKNKKQIEEIERNRPVYTPPEEAQQYLDVYKTMAGNRDLPGQSQYEENIQQASATGTRNIQNLTESPTASLGAMTELYGQEMNAYNNLAVQQQQYYEANQQKYAQALSEMAKYRDMEWELNKYNPWGRKMQNKINEYVSNRGLMQQGKSTWANASANFGGFQGTNQPMQEPQSNVNYGAMRQDINQPTYMDNMGGSQYGGYA